IIDVEADEALEIEEYIPIEVEEEEVVEEEIFLVVENQPEFPGGEAARLKYLSENIEYPQMAKESGIQGIVFVTFVVEPNGSISNVAILRGIGGGCDEEAVRVVQNMPSWKPGKQRGRPVRVRFNMPIKFTLQ
ncbi:MAG: energy transducer TonB, partial [Bacteroidales bacterium]|nr:energy transducer TonB [Bacteroidales bacterium]